MGFECLGIDPGTKQSGYVHYRDGKVIWAGVSPNEEILDLLKRYSCPEVVAIEDIQSYGARVGRETFETCVWIGRFIQASSYPGKVIRINRQAVKRALLGKAAGNDSTIRQALIGRLGAPGTTKNPGPTFGVKSHAWQALGVAYAAERINGNDGL